MRNLDCFLIDNDEEDQEIFCLALEEINSQINCRTANSGVAALALFQSEPQYVPDLIFVDLNMPLMDGKECLSKLREIKSLNQVPVYMYSTDASPRIVKDLKEAGARDVLIKPGSFRKLKELLANLLNNHTV